MIFLNDILHTEIDMYFCCLKIMCPNGFFKKVSCLLVVQCDCLQIIPLRVSQGFAQMFLTELLIFFFNFSRILIIFAKMKAYLVYCIGRSLN